MQWQERGNSIEENVEFLMVTESLWIQGIPEEEKEERGGGKWLADKEQGWEHVQLMEECFFMRRFKRPKEYQKEVVDLYQNPLKIT